MSSGGTGHFMSFVWEGELSAIMHQDNYSKYCAIVEVMILTGAVEESRLGGNMICLCDC